MIFENIWVQPAAGDSGGALGSALFHWYKTLNQSRTTDPNKDSMQGAYLGPKYKNEDMLGVDTYTIKDGIMVKKILIKHPDMDKKKLIIANKSSFVGIFIDDGKLGLCGTDKFYILGDKLELLNKIFNFKICTIISSFTRYRQHFLDKDVFTYIPDIRKLNINDINEQDFYKLLKLTNDEINLIMNI
jgi:hypothetical protein